MSFVTKMTATLIASMFSLVAFAMVDKGINPDVDTKPAPVPACVKANNCTPPVVTPAPVCKPSKTNTCMDK